MAKYPLRPEGVGFIVFFGLLAALSGLAIDIGLPALSTIADSLDILPSKASLTITVFLAGLAIAPLAYGPLSDRYGRRPLIIAGCILFTLAGIGVTFSPDINLILLFRFLQGAGVGAGSTLSLSVVRDLFSGARARTLLSYIAIVRLLGPMAAPSIGAIILDILEWRWIYAFLAICGLCLTIVMILCIDETAPKFKAPEKYKPMPVLTSYLTVVRNPVYIGYTAIVAIGFASQFSFVTGSPLVMMQSLGVSARGFGILFAMSAFGVMLASFTNSQMSLRGVSPSKLLWIGLSISVIATVTLVLLTITGWASPATLMPCFIVHSFSYGLVAPNAQQRALQPLGHCAGAAAALLSSCTMLFGALGGMLVGRLYSSLHILAVTGSMCMFCCISLSIYVLMVKKKLVVDDIGEDEEIKTTPNTNTSLAETSATAQTAN